MADNNKACRIEEKGDKRGGKEAYIMMEYCSAIPFGLMYGAPQTVYNYKKADWNNFKNVSSELLEEL